MNINFYNERKENEKKNKKNSTLTKNIYQKALMFPKFTLNYQKLAQIL